MRAGRRPPDSRTPSALWGPARSFYGCAMQIERIGTGPIIEPSSDPSVGDNIQGPSMIRVPDWVDAPLGRFYLYFADHKGRHIRLAYADAVDGPWTIHPPGALPLADSCFLTEPPDLSAAREAAIAERYVAAVGADAMPADLRADLTTPHIASPDVHVDDDQRRFRLYFHGLASLGTQVTRVATSADGLSFTVAPTVLGPSYFRVFETGGYHYALVMPGVMRRSISGMADFVVGPTLFESTMRHSAVLLDGTTLHVLWSRVGDAPESLLHSTIDIAGDWMTWAAEHHGVVLRPEHPWEGSDLPVAASQRGAAVGRQHQLRDPAIFRDPVTGAMRLLYAVAGESGIALAELTL